MQETRKTATENIRLLFIDGDKPLKLAHLFSSLRPHSYHFSLGRAANKKEPPFTSIVSVLRGRSPAASRLYRKPISNR